MKSGFIMVDAPFELTDPPSQPVPFPIRLIQDDVKSDPPKAKRSDYFYDAWDKFLAIEPKRAKQTSRAAKKVEEIKKEVEQSPGDGLLVEENAATSWEQAAAECRAKVAAIVGECERLNQKYRDAMFDLEDNAYGLFCLQSLDGKLPTAIDNIDPPPWIKRVEDIFDNPQFFIDGATANDVHQGSSGDCWFLAALMAVSAKKELIDNICVARNEKVGVYGFVFYRDGDWIYEVIDDKLYLRVGDDDKIDLVRDWNRDKKKGMSLKHDEEKLLDQLQRGGEALYFSHCKSNETWLPLIEKAYAKAHGDYAAIEGGFASEGIEDLTGGVGAVINPEDIMDKDRFWREQLSQVNEKYLFGGGTKPTDTKGFIGSHAYAVLSTFEEGDLRLLKLRNPWGEVEWEGDWSDGSKLWTPEMMKKLEHTFGDDGIFWISYKDFLKHFPSINRVRLLNKDWQVAQRWTSVNVPWTVDYLDTKFQFSITEKSSVVIVLSQPDDRYFDGLKGRMTYSLHFRVYKEGSEGRWIVRSMHNSGNETLFTRSVSAEIEDLDPGTYNIVFKVTARRTRSLTTSGEAIMKYAAESKEKLLHMGRRFDYAQSKGNLRALEEANKKQKKQDDKDQQENTWKKARRMNQQSKERSRKRKKRIDDAMREKRREYQDKQRERATLIRERTMKRRGTGSTDAQLGAGGDEKSEVKADATPQSSPTKTETDAFASVDDSKKTETTRQASESKEDTVEDAEEASDPEALAKSMSELELQRSKTTQTSGSSHRSVYTFDDDDYQSPIEPPERLDDDDFDWDSDIDGTVVLGEDDDSRRCSASGTKNEIFADDPWNAMCVLGLRLYSLGTTAKLSVVTHDEDTSLSDT